MLCLKLSNQKGLTITSGDKVLHLKILSFPCKNTVKLGFEGDRKDFVILRDDAIKRKEFVE